MSDKLSNNPNEAPRGDANGDNSPVSAKKVAANAKNAQKSTGPRTEAGKAKAAMNTYRHGFFAKHLFPTTQQAAEDKEDYLAVANGIHEHYQPVGYLENFWVEKIATEALRAARLIAHEQKVLSWTTPFEERSVSNLLRYQASINRDMARAIAELERLQAKRVSELGSQNLPDAGEAAANPEQPEDAPPVVPKSPAVVLVSCPSTKGEGAQAEPLAPRYENCGTNPPLARGSGSESPSDLGNTSRHPDSWAVKGNEKTPPKSLADPVSDVLEVEDY